MFLKTEAIVVSAMVRRRKNQTGFAERLAQLRKSRNITQTELARAVGVTQGMISFYEKGTTDPSTSVMVALAKTLKVSTDELLGLREPSLRAGANENFHLMRRLRQVEHLSARQRRNVLQMIEDLVPKETVPKRA